MNPEKEAEIIAMYDSGLKVADIAQEAMVSQSTVRKVLGERLQRRRVRTDEDEIITEYTSDVPVPQILVDHGLTYSALYSILYRNGIPPRKVAVQEMRNERLETAVQMYLDGVKLWQICNETGVHQPTLHAELHRRGIPLRRETKRKATMPTPTQPPSAEEQEA